MTMHGSFAPGCRKLILEDMNVPEPPLQRLRPSRAPISGLQMMVAILVALLLLAIFANVQKFRANSIESVTITPASSATPEPNER